MNILVTGAAGSIGKPLVSRLKTLNHLVSETDIDNLDVTNPALVSAFVTQVKPHIIVHLAGFKQAPGGEHDPVEVARINIDGTKNVVATGVRVILASTCKAAEPETVYGASKLIAERIVLNAGGTVARFYNIREAEGNVFRLWEAIPEDEPIPVTPCMRYFISMNQAVDLLCRCLYLPSGRYAVEQPEQSSMENVARKLYPGRELMKIPRRRGDRFSEPMIARCEGLEPAGRPYVRITNPHDA